MKYIAVLGRQSEISLAELSAIFGDSVRKIGPETAVFESKTEPNIDRFGGVLKFGKLITESPIDFLLNTPDFDGKFIIGISDYSKGDNRRKSQNTAMKYKKILSRQGRSVRVLQNTDAALSTATSFHNQVGIKPGHVEFILAGKEIYSVIGVQNIDKYRERDQVRPARDAKVGMLPPKLAQILINLCGDLPKGSRILDPFCGTGVVLQEASLMGYKVYGTDKSERMIDYSLENLKWLEKKFNVSVDKILEVGDATSHQWSGKIDAVAAEGYLGVPMSKPPVEIKLKEQKQECASIALGFLKNLAPQIQSGTPVVLALPAWRREDGSYSGLSILDEAEKLGYNGANSSRRLLYFRDGQVVAREIIRLRKK